MLDSSTFSEMRLRNKKISFLFSPIFLIKYCECFSHLLSWTCCCLLLRIFSSSSWLKSSSSDLADDEAAVDAAEAHEAAEATETRR